MKNYILLIILGLLLSSTLFADRYRIGNVSFISKGKTDAKMIERRILPIDKEKVFDSKDEVIQYFSSIEQQLENTRLLENIIYTYSFEKNPSDEDTDLEFANAEFSFEDSSSMIVFPAPSYDSNSGFKINLVMNDSNFLGKASPFTMSLMSQFGNEKSPNDFSKITLGSSLACSIPFTIGTTVDNFHNFFNISWDLSEKNIELNDSAGVTIGIPVGKKLLNITATQGITKDNTYKKYDDELYFNEKLSARLPFTVAMIDNKTPIFYTPFIEGDYNWDANGINNANLRLKSTPKLTFGHTISTYHIDWIGNFREGYTFSATASIAKNFETSKLDETIISTISFYAKFLKSWKKVGFQSNLYYFNILNADNGSLKNIGYFVRGALDKQNFSTNIDFDYNYALETDSALIANIEFPIHLFTTDWQNLFHKESKLFNYTNFEAQIAPFIDIALLKNRATNNSYRFEEGIYCAGLELLLFPEHWKSYVVRISFGMDIGSKLFGKNYDDKWRNPKKKYEFSIGFGTHF